MDQMLVKAARVGDVRTLHNLIEGDPEILERASSAHFVDSALHVAALYGKSHFVEQIVTRKPSLATDTNQQGMIPLHLASLEGHVETVRELLKAKLDDGVVNQCLVKDDEGWTPLHCASQKGKISVIQELIRECPECLEQVTAKGETVVHVSVRANQFEAVKVLADRIRHHNLLMVLKAQDQKGKIAYQLAAAKKQLQVVEVLKENDEEGDEIREERRINVEEEGSEKEEEMSNESQSQQGATLVVAALIITLTYQALASTPSIFFKDGSNTIDWGCLNQTIEWGSPEAFIKHLKDCPALTALLFMIGNTLLFFQSIYVLLLAGPSIVPVQLLALYLTMCYSILLMTLSYYAVYLAMPFVLASLAFFWFSSKYDLPQSQRMRILNAFAKKRRER